MRLTISLAMCATLVVRNLVTLAADACVFELLIYIFAASFFHVSC
jgi:hypothetical protein